MKQVTIQDATLQKAATEGMDAFVGAFVVAIKETIGGELTADTLSELNSDQITLLAWDTLHQEVMDGGFVHHEQIERDCTDDEFMALFEQFPEFDDLDDEFVEREEEWTEQVAHYIDEHIEKFANVEK